MRICVFVHESKNRCDFSLCRGKHIQSLLKIKKPDYAFKNIIIGEKYYTTLDLLHQYIYNKAKHLCVYVYVFIYKKESLTES